MWPFRRKAGRHQLGAAVTAIPQLPLTPALPGYDAPPAPPEPVPEPVAEPVAEPVVAAYEPAVAAEPRVELGFRDGSTAALAPGSAQARALTEIASVLTRRD